MESVKLSSVQLTATWLEQNHSTIQLSSFSNLIWLYIHISLSEVALDSVVKILSSIITHHLNFHILVIITHLIAFFVLIFIFNNEPTGWAYGFMDLFNYDENRWTDWASFFMLNTTVTVEATINNKICLGWVKNKWFIDFNRFKFCMNQYLLLNLSRCCFQSVLFLVGIFYSSSLSWDGNA